MSSLPCDTPSVGEESTTSILDLPQEILEAVFTLLSPDLDDLVALSSVCRQFRFACAGVPLRAALHVPVPDPRLDVLSSRGFPVEVLCCREAAMFVGYQIERLNLSRLRTAELVANDYITGRHELSPHYVRVLDRVSSRAAGSLRHLLANLDMKREGPGGLMGDFRCVRLVTSFKNLTFLSVAFTQGIELQQKVTGRDDGQKVLSGIVDGLPKLKSLYIFCCATDRLKLKSESLEKLHIYKSEFAAVRELKAPKLRKFMFHNSLAEYFAKVEANQPGERGGENEGGGGGGCGEAGALFSILYEGCPELESFNGVNLGCLKGRGLGKAEWCYYAVALCFKKYRSQL